MIWRDALIRCFLESGKHEMSYEELAQMSINSGFRNPTKTPVATISSYFTTHPDCKYLKRTDPHTAQLISKYMTKKFKNEVLNFKTMHVKKKDRIILEKKPKKFVGLRIENTLDEAKNSQSKSDLSENSQPTDNDVNDQVITRVKKTTPVKSRKNRTRKRNSKRKPIVKPFLNSNVINEIKRLNGSRIQSDKVRTYRNETLPIQSNIQYFLDFRFGKSKFYHEEQDLYKIEFVGEFTLPKDEWEEYKILKESTKRPLLFGYSDVAILCVFQDEKNQNFEDFDVWIIDHDASEEPENIGKLSKFLSGLIVDKD